MHTHKRFTYVIGADHSIELHHPFWRIPRYFPADQVSAGFVDLRLLEIHLVQPHVDSDIAEA